MTGLTCTARLIFGIIFGSPDPRLKRFKVYIYLFQLRSLLSNIFFKNCLVIRNIRNQYFYSSTWVFGVRLEYLFRINPLSPFQPADAPVLQCSSATWLSFTRSPAFCCKLDCRKRGLLVQLLLPDRAQAGAAGEYASQLHADDEALCSTPSPGFGHQCGRVRNSEKEFGEMGCQRQMPVFRWADGFGDCGWPSLTGTP